MNTYTEKMHRKFMQEANGDIFKGAVFCAVFVLLFLLILVVF